MFFGDPRATIPLVGPWINPTTDWLMFVGQIIIAARHRLFLGIYRATNEHKK